MVWDSHEYQIFCAYTVTILFVIAAMVLLCILFHLLYVARQKCKKRDNGKTVMFFLILTVIGICSFFFSVLLIIAVIVQIILIDGHELHPESNPFHDFYYSSFEEMEYSIAIFDSFGHLCMLTIFMVRFQICFENSIFGYSQRLMRIMHIILIILILSSLAIIIEIIRDDHDVYVIIITEIIWELAIEFMVLWLLYLFVTKLYQLIKMTMTQSNTHKTQRTVFADIIRSISPKLESNRSCSNHSKSGSDKKSKSNPISKQQNSAYNMNNIQKTEEQQHHKTHNELEPGSIASYTMHPASLYRHGSVTRKHDDQLTTNHNNNNNNNDINNGNRQIVDLLNIMNKLTLLVVISVFSSILSLIGNIFIELHELETIEQHTADIDSMWAFLLPVADIIITSFMLYLQFNFTQNVYVKMCYHLDILFLRLCLKINSYFLKKKDKENTIKSIENTQTEPSGQTTVRTVSSKALSQSADVPRVESHCIEVTELPALSPANSRVPLSVDVDS